MSGLFGTLGVARSALYAQQLVLQTTSNNVANASRTDYSRQRVDLAASVSETLPMGQVGTGVTAAGIRRIRDSFLDRQYWQAQQSLGEQSASQSTLSQIESLLGEPSDSGLQAHLTSFFSAVQGLQSNPQDPTTRSTVLEQASALADGFQHLSTGLQDLKTNLESDINQKVAQINSLVKDIGALNGQIKTQALGGGPTNTLMDQRDSDVDALAKLVGINRSEQTDGTMVITLAGSGSVLVYGTDTQALTAGPGASDTYTVALNGVAVTPNGGELAGTLSARNDPNDFVKYTQGRLDTLAATLIEQVNRIQASGSGLVGLSATQSQYAVSDPSAALTAAGLPFTLAPGSFQVFTYDASNAVTGSATITITGTTSLNDLATQIGAVTGLSASVANGKLSVTAVAGTTFRFAADTSNALAALGLNSLFTGSTAATIGVNSDLIASPNQLSTGIADAATGVVAPADTTSAVALSQLQTAKLLDSGQASVGDYYAETIGVLGTRTAAANQAVETNTAITDAIQNQRQQVSGVSIDEEMIQLTQAQRAYQAATRVVTIVDDLLNTLINVMT